METLSLIPLFAFCCNIIEKFIQLLKEYKIHIKNEKHTIKDILSIL